LEVAELKRAASDFVKRDRTARLLGVAYLLYRHPNGLTAQQIADRTGMHVRTVYRDLRALEEEVGVAVWQDGKRYGAEQTSFLPPLKLTLQEAVTLFLSVRLMARYQDHRDPHVISAFAKLASILPAPIGQHVQASLVSLSARPPDDQRARIFDLLAVAWAEGRKVRIWYVPAREGDSAPLERTVSPFFIEPNPGGHTRYLIGQNSLSGEVRTFKLERIREAELTREGFTVPPEFDAAERLGTAWGVSDEDSVHVRLRFHDAVAAKRARESQWHPSQHEERNMDGTTDFTFDVNGLLEITPWIPSWGGAVEALEPPDLRQRIVGVARELVGRYGETG
jgi:predicted DNA-binding transcriptional regulator YafY